MNIALSILSAAASAEAAGTAEAYSGPWENVYNAVHSTAEAVTEEAQGVVDRIQGLGDAHAQLADPDYWGSVGIITLTGILVVFFILAILIFLFWALGKTFQTIDKNRAAKAEAAKKADEIKTALEKRVDNQKSTYKDYTPDEMYKFDDCFVKQDGNTVYYAVTADNTKAADILG